MNDRLVIEKNTVALINEYVTCKEEIESMSQRNKLLSQMSIDAQNKKKVLKSVLLLIRKRTFELKEKVFKYRKNDFAIQKELSLILTTYKIKE